MEGGGGLVMVARILFGATLGTSGISRLCPSSTAGAWTGRLDWERFRCAPPRPVGTSAGCLGPWSPMSTQL